MNSSFLSLNGSSITYTIDEIPTLVYAPERPNSNNLNQSSSTTASTATQLTTTTTTTSPIYEENTFINWSQETQNILHNKANLSKKWITLVLLALVLGYTAAAINLISISLNDLKKGICLSDLDAWSIFNPYLTLSLIHI